MKFADQLNDGLSETLNRLCGATVNTYSFKAKAADINDALDWYFQLAFKAGMNWEFDDINKTSPPIDTQNIVSGTNRYKVGTFTEKIINLIKLEVLDSAGTGHTLIPETFDTLGSASGIESGILSGVVGDSFEELYIGPPSGIPTHYAKFGDFIYLRPSPNYASTAGLKAYFNRPASKFNFVTFTVTIASPGVFTATAHGLAANDTMILNTTGALPTGLSVDTQYWVISTGLSTDDFRLSTSLGGTAINTSGTQSGTHSFLKTNGEPGIVSVHHQALCRKAALTYRSMPGNAGSEGTLAALFQQVLLDERTISAYFSDRDKDLRKRLSPAAQDNR